MLIEQFISGKTIICETCGFDYYPPANPKDVISTISSISSEEDKESNEILEDNADYNQESDEIPEQDYYTPQKDLQQQNQETITVDGQSSRINEKIILKFLTGNWKTMRELARDLNIQDAREFYVLRMILNELNRKGSITMDFQIDRVLIRRKK